MRKLPAKRMLATLAVGISVGCALSMAESQLGMDSESFWLNMEAADSPVSVLGEEQVALDGVSDMDEEEFEGTGEVDDVGVSDDAGDWGDATVNLEEEDGPNGVGDGVEVLESAASVELQQLLNSIFRCRTRQIALVAENGELMKRCSECKEPTLQSSTVLNGSALSLSSMWRVVRRGFDRVALQSDTRRFLGRCNGCTPGASEDAAFASVRGPFDSAVWKIIPRPEGRLVLQSGNGKYLARCNHCAPGAGSDQVYVHVAEITDTNAQWKARCVSPTEFRTVKRAEMRRLQQLRRQKAQERLKQRKRFSIHAGAKTIFQCRTRRVALVSDDGQYLSRCANCEQPGLQSSIVLNGSALNPESAWTAYRRGFDTVTLRADNQQFLSRCSGCMRGTKLQEAVLANARSPGSSAPWKMILLPEGRIALQSDNGKYLARCNDCAPGGGGDQVFVHVSDPSSPNANWKPECLSSTQVIAVQKIFRERQKKLQLEKREKMMRERERMVEQVRELQVSSRANPRVVASVFHCRSRMVALQADNGQYLSRCTGCENDGLKSPAVLNSSIISTSSMWQVKRRASYSMTLRSTNGQYLSRCNKCVPGAQFEDSAVLGKLSKRYGSWLVYPHASGSVSLLSGNGHYLARCKDCPSGASGDQAFVHAANASDATAQWKVVCLSSKEVRSIRRAEGQTRHVQGSRLQTSSNPFAKCRGRRFRLRANDDSYLSRCHRCGRTRYRDSATLKSTGSMRSPFKWNAILLPNNRVALRSDNGFFLARCFRCAPGLYQNVGMVSGRNPRQRVAQWKWYVLPNGKVAFRSDRGRFLGRIPGKKRGRHEYVAVDLPSPRILQAQWTVECE